MRRKSILLGSFITDGDQDRIGAVFLQLLRHDLRSVQPEAAGTDFVGDELDLERKIYACRSLDLSHYLQEQPGAIGKRAPVIIGSRIH